MKGKILAIGLIAALFIPAMSGCGSSTTDE